MAVTFPTTTPEKETLVSDDMFLIADSENSDKASKVKKSLVVDGLGTVNSVSVTTANGISGTVATATTTPAITLDISALDAAKIADGSVSDTEFQYLDGVTSSIQDQLDTKGVGDVVGPASSTDSVPALFDGTTGKLIKNSTPTGTGNPVLATSPTLVTPDLGAATATSIFATGTTEQLRLGYDGSNYVSMFVTASGTPKMIASGQGLLTLESLDAAGDVGLLLETVNGVKYSFFVDYSQDEDFRIFAYNNSKNILKYDTSLDKNILGSATVQFDNYGSGTNTGTLAYTLGVDSSGNIIELDDVVREDATQTLTNKRVTERVGTTTSSATPTINTDNVDMYILTAQAVDITSFTTNLSGTPTNGQKLWIAITGTAARAITRGPSFENGAVDLPTTTITTQRLDIGFVWNAATSKRRCMAAGPLS